MNLSNLTGKKFNRIKTTAGGNIYSDGDLICYLKPVTTSRQTKNKKPVYYLSLLDNGHSTYLSGLFKTDSDAVFSADYSDSLAVKHMVKIIFSDTGETMDVQL